MAERVRVTFGSCLAAIVLTVYYPAIKSPLNPMDDRAIVNWLFNLDGISLKNILFTTSDYFYRPVLLMTYLADKYLWGAEASFMHLENVIIHAANVLLVHIIATQISGHLGHDSRWLPFSAALLFALHPLNTESVNWIAGRSDLLAGLFVLLSCWILLRGLERNSHIHALLSLLVLVPGVFSKETALFFIPAAFFIIISFPFESKQFSPSVVQRVVDCYRFILPFIAAPFLYLIARFAMLLSRDTGSSMALAFLSDRDGVLNVVHTAMTGSGFYAKKMIIPWPLNFAISKVPEQYFWAGLILVPLILYCLYRMDLLGAMFISAILLGFSAILALILRPAWTPVAERYMYVPSAFFCIAISVTVYRLIKGVSNQRLLASIVVLLFAATAYATVDRNVMWQDNVRLFQDTVSKSPDSPFARSVLADLLMESGRSAEGKLIIQSNRAPAGLRNADYLDLKRALLLHEERKFTEARELILEKRIKTGQLYHTFQKLLLKVDEQLVKSLSGSDKDVIHSEIISLHKELYEAYRDPFYYYRLGQFYMQGNDKVSAAKYFSLAQRESPPDSHYKKAAGILADRLSKQ